MPTAIPTAAPTRSSAACSRASGGEWDGFAFEPSEFVDGGDTVVMTGRYTGTYKATGRPINCQVAHFWTLEGGKVVQFQQLVDTLAVARCTGAV